MEPGRLLRASLDDAAFTLRLNIRLFAPMLVFILVYSLASVYNLLHSKQLSTLPVGYRLAIATPIVVMMDFLVALLVAATATAFLDQEKSQRILEYQAAFSPLSIGEYLAVKTISGLMVGVLIAAPYAIGVTWVISTVTSVDLGFALTVAGSTLLGIAAFTLLLTLAAIALEPRQSSLVRMLVIILPMIMIASFTNTVAKSNVENFASTFTRMTVPLYIASLAALLAAITVFYALRDRLAEAMLRY